MEQNRWWRRKQVQAAPIDCCCMWRSCDVETQDGRVSPDVYCQSNERKHRSYIKLSANEAHRAHMTSCSLLHVLWAASQHRAFSYLLSSVFSPTNSASFLQVQQIRSKERVHSIVPSRGTKIELELGGQHQKGLKTANKQICTNANIQTHLADMVSCG